MSKPFNLLFIFLEVQYQKQNVILCLTYEKCFGQFFSNWSDSTREIAHLASKANIFQK